MLLGWIKSFSWRSLAFISRWSGFSLLLVWQKGRIEDLEGLTHPECCHEEDALYIIADIINVDLMQGPLLQPLICRTPAKCLFDCFRTDHILWPMRRVHHRCLCLWKWWCWSVQLIWGGIVLLVQSCCWLTASTARIFLWFSLNTSSTFSEKRFCCLPKMS